MAAQAQAQAHIGIGIGPTYVCKNVVHMRLYSTGATVTQTNWDSSKDFYLLFDFKLIILYIYPLHVFCQPHLLSSDSIFLSCSRFSSTY